MSTKKCDHQKRAVSFAAVNGNFGFSDVKVHKYIRD
jgi:hypothetical protein